MHGNAMQAPRLGIAISAKAGAEDKIESADIDPRAILNFHQSCAAAGSCARDAARGGNWRKLNASGMGRLGEQSQERYSRFSLARERNGQIIRMSHDVHAIVELTSPHLRDFADSDARPGHFSMRARPNAL
jgi:hypothetical protein